MHIWLVFVCVSLFKRTEFLVALMYERFVLQVDSSDYFIWRKVAITFITNIIWMGLQIFALMSFVAEEIIAGTYSVRCCKRKS